MKLYSFKKQLEEGNKGEDLFLSCYKNLNPRKFSTNDYDIIINKNDKVEIKCDTWDEKDTPNFFIERYSNDKKKNDGGPFRAKNSKYFIYLFIKNKTFYWFCPNKLCDFLSNRLKGYEKKYIRNNGYYTIGYLVPRIDLEHLLIRKDKF